MFRTAKFRAAFARSLGIALAAILAAPLVCAPRGRKIRRLCASEALSSASMARSVWSRHATARTKTYGRRQCANRRHHQGILSDIKQNSFVAVTAMPQPDGSLNAVEVHIFPESMRGTGEGHYPWDLQPQSTMTNANVEQVVSAVDGRTLTLKYKDGEKKITVPR